MFDGSLYNYTGDAYAYVDSLYIFTGDAYAYDDSSSSDSDDEVLKRYQSTLKQRGSIQRSDTRQSISKSHSTSAKKKSKFDLSQLSQLSHSIGAKKKSLLTQNTGAKKKR